MFSASPSASGPPAHPRVGVATFVVDDRDYILIGKRKGSHGSGTLALPGGHLEWQESFEECAARELVEETGIEVGGTAESSVEFLTAVNTTHLKDPTDSGEGKHYVTIFMMARVRRRIGQDEVIARVMEPTKCDGWTWVPLNYLFSRHGAQSSLERYASSAEAQGDTLGVPLDRLLLAERLGQRITGAAETVQGDVDPARSPMSPGVGVGGTMAGEAPGAGAGADDDEIAAFALADDLAGGASFFRPLSDLLQHHGELLRGAVLSHTQPPSPPSAGNITSPAPQLPASILSDDATTIINDALKAPPHLKHHLTISIPAPTPHHADQIAAILKVDKPLRPYDTSISYWTNSTVVYVEVKASTVRLLRLSVNAILDDVSLVVRTMEAFPGPLRAHEVEAMKQTQDGGEGAEDGDTFEQGTVGKVEQINAVG